MINGNLAVVHEVLAVEFGLLIYLPIIFFLARRANRGGEGEKVAFVVNLALLWLSAFLFFGYAGLIAGALFATGAIFVAMISLTATSLFSRDQ